MSRRGRARKKLVAGVDRLFHDAVLNRPRRSPNTKLGPEARVRTLRMLLRTFDVEQNVSQRDTFFTEPPVPSLRTKKVRTIRRRGRRQGEVVDVSFPSQYELFFSDIADRYDRHPNNRRAHARLFLHETPRPTLILLHGYMGGAHAFEERVWPIKTFFRWGLNVALAVLPFHGLRASPRRIFSPVYPSSDPRVTIDAFRQSIFDLRALTSALHERGAQPVGAMGMSLGGYTTALLATAEPRLRFAVPFIPLASIADFARDGDQLVGTYSQREAQHKMLEKVYEVVSPLSREPLVPRDGRMVVAGTADRITPIAHAERIARRFDVDVTTYDGAHLLQAGRGAAFDAVEKMLSDIQLIEPK